MEHGHKRGFDVETQATCEEPTGEGRGGVGALLGRRLLRKSRWAVDQE